jgi:hypothetical protein
MAVEMGQGFRIGDRAAQLDGASPAAIRRSSFTSRVAMTAEKLRDP